LRTNDVTTAAQAARKERKGKIKKNILHPNVVEEKKRAEV